MLSQRRGRGVYNQSKHFHPMVNPVSYSQSIINALERTLSPERLSTYLAAAGGDHAAALQLYVWITQISAALYGPLCPYSPSSYYSAAPLIFNGSCLPLLFSPE